jgi:hypothetical protein
MPIYPDDIEIMINGEAYTREYPNTLEEAQGLIDSLVKINNHLDAAFLQYQEVSNQEKDELVIKLNTLEQYNTTIKKQIDEGLHENAHLSTLVNNYMKQSKNNLLLLTSLGPSYRLLDNTLGMEMSIGAVRKISVFNLINCYAGLNMNTTIYYHDVKNIISNIGLALQLGIFLK